MKRKRKINLFNLSILIFSLSFLLYIYSSIFVRGEIVRLNIEIQDVQAKINAIHEVNEARLAEISEKTSYSYLKPLIHELGLSVSYDNVVNLRNDRSAESLGEELLSETTGLQEPHESIEVVNNE